METISVFGSKLGSLAFPFSKLSRFPLPSVPSKPVKYIRLKAACRQTSNDQENIRKFNKFPPSELTRHFQSLPDDFLEMDTLKSEINTLKLEVKNTLLISSQDIGWMKKRILSIYLLVSLGLAYHFEYEIEKILKDGFEKIEEMMADEDDLYTVSTIFWVFRTHGHNMCSDVFKKFKGNNRKFNESLTKDAKGMLSLYEAAHLRTTTDFILDEALSFTSNHLDSLAASGTCPSHLSKRIRNALCLSQHRNMEILVAVEYISFYEQEKDHDQLLLKFAKINFQLLQAYYIQELKTVTKWYKEIDLASKLPPFFKDRTVENHFLIVGMYFEPEFSQKRIMLTKFFVISLLADDTSDRYASFAEAESLADSIQRGAPSNVMDGQPDYLQFVFKFILDVLDEIEKEMRPEGRSYSVEATIEEFKRLVRANADHAKWAHTAQVPSFEQYMEFAEVEIGVYSTMASLLMCMGHIASEEAFEWLKSRPQIVQSLCRKTRLMNDITGFEDDIGRGNFTTGVNCYMKQHGVTKEEAIKRLREMLAYSDKILNEEYLKKSHLPRQVLKVVINFARTMNVTYNEGDEYTHPGEKNKDYISSLFLNRFCL